MSSSPPEEVLVLSREQVLKRRPQAYLDVQASVEPGRGLALVGLSDTVVLIDAKAY